jgi:hypothetical protein
MAVSRIKTSSVLQGFPKSRSLLAGNAAYDPAATFLIQRVAGTGSSGTITFSSIPSTYKHLQIRLLARSTQTGVSNISALIQCNSDTGSNYARHTLQGDGASALASGTSSTSLMTLFRITAASAAANIMGVGIVDIHDYQSTTKYKTLRSFAGQDENGVGSIRLQSGLWQSTSAISSLSIYLSSDSFTTTTSVALYGMLG